ncbi:MAG: type I restriction enzyme HsdR N-terminal domain-containing protein [Lachnospiraceae bacterium]|nr:type I restriction enzyme HsdR N-terminal domain-containing protein [Lachnospiraceae bacterium]
MDFIEKLTNFSNRIERIKGSILTEEATKTSIILPFFQLLGYDVFNPYEFVPEYTADVGIKKGEKVDYAILINNEPLILIETKSVNTELSAKHTNQLVRYFSVTKAKLGILTNGIIYQFYSDLEEHNKMDTIPFLEINLSKIKKETAEELKRFQKDAFDIKGILSNAADLKYMTMIKNEIAEQFKNPSDQLVKVLINKNVYSGTKTQAVIDKFKLIIQKAFDEYINDTLTERLSSVISPDTTSISLPKETSENILTSEEKDALDFVKEMLNTSLDIKYKKTSRYGYMQLGESSTKWICRVYIRKDQHLFTLHKFEDTNYECEYYFDEIEQLELIHDVIKDTFEKCCKL